MTRARILTYIALLALSGCAAEPAAPAAAPPPAPAASSPASAEPTVTPPTEDKTVTAAKKVVQRFFDRSSAGDFAGAWELYTAAGKKAIDQATFVKVQKRANPKVSPLTSLTAAWTATTSPS